MRVLIFHGYLLRGTGSNVYNAELAQALVGQGHDVELVCQDVDAAELDWVDAVGRWNNAGELVVEELRRIRDEDRGRCTVHLPPIAGRLPVYVQDNYEHFEARTFDQFDDDELKFYIDRNVMAVRQVVERARPNFALANHMVMGPFIVAQAVGGKIPYVVKIHGSAMEYTVRPHPRFLPYATRGVGGARAVLVGSRHIASRTWDTLRIADLEQRIFLGPPGVDIERFKPRERSEARVALVDAAEQAAAKPRNGWSSRQVEATAGLYERARTAARSDGMLSWDEVAEAVRDLQNDYDTAGIDWEAPERLQRLASIGSAPLVLYVGKLIVSKGVDLLIAAWPLVLREEPDARLLITGFGAYREGLELLIDALADGDMPTVRWIVEGGRALEGGEQGRLTILSAFFDSLSEEALEQYLVDARQLRDSISFVGRFEHDIVSQLIPAADCQIVPSTFPEAFGMVAAEAAACGVPPICAEHSGLLEVIDKLREHLSGVGGTMLGFGLSDWSVQHLAARIRTATEMTDEHRAELSARLVRTARDEFSWGGVARELITAGTGPLDELRKP
jgi:glycosyltransferase involved in cell wall biosynthesis